MSEIKFPRLNLYLPLEMQAELKTVAAQRGISTSEVVRRIIDEWREGERDPLRISGFDALTEEELRMFVANRFLELSRYAVAQEAQVREIQRLAKEAGQTPEEWIAKNRGITIV